MEKQTSKLLSIELKNRQKWAKTICFLKQRHGTGCKVLVVTLGCDSHMTVNGTNDAFHTVPPMSQTAGVLSSSSLCSLLANSESTPLIQQMTQRVIIISEQK